MKKIFITLIVSFFFISCERESCVTCIAESKEGKIIENRMACDKSDSYLQGFVDGFTDKHQENVKDSINVHCAYSG